MALFATRCVSTTVPLQDGERDSDLGTGLRQPCSSSAKTKRRRTSDRGELAVVSASTNQFQEASLVERIADAVLYEGYMLYPYRPSSVKNQQRWNFGVLCPRSYSEAQKGAEAWTMQTECLVDGSSMTGLEVRVRFLQLVARSVGQLTMPIGELLPGVVPEFRPVEKLMIDGRVYQPWQEALEREVVSPVHNLE